MVKEGGIESIVKAAEVTEPVFPALSVRETRTLAVVMLTAGVDQLKEKGVVERGPFVDAIVPIVDHVLPLKYSTTKF